MSQEIGITTIADRYAEAMLTLADENSVLEPVKTDLQLVAQTIKENQDFRKFIEHPIIPVKDKKEIFEKVFKDKINHYVINLVKLLFDRNRVYILQAIATSFKKLFNKKFNIVQADIITAITIDDGTQETIKNKLAQLLSKQIEVQSVVDPAIIGGMVIRIEDSIIDGSIKGQLDNLKQQLI